MRQGDDDELLASRLDEARDELAATIISALDAGATIASISEQLGISIDEVDRLVGGA